MNSSREIWISAPLPPGSEQIMAGEDATIELDGVTVTNSSNTIKDVIAGTTFDPGQGRRGDDRQSHHRTRPDDYQETTSIILSPNTTR